MSPKDKLDHCPICGKDYDLEEKLSKAKEALEEITSKKKELGFLGMNLRAKRALKEIWGDTKGACEVCGRKYECPCPCGECKETVQRHPDPPHSERRGWNFLGY